MAELFEKGQQTISEHLVNIYKEEEVPETATHRKIRLVQKEGNREVERLVSHYNLDVIISVGYRVKSQRGVQFRQWATSVLKDHLIKGVSINSQKLYEMEKLFQQSELKNSMRFAEIRETLKYLIEKDDPLTRLI
jgi:hypothetical protein